MITILNNIMTGNGFTLVDITTSENEISTSLYKSESPCKEEYFLTLESNSPSSETLKYLLDEKAQSLFEQIQNSGKVERYFEKNCTMLICIKSENLDNNQVLSIEEDPYNFKKNVIIYSTEELVALNKYLQDNDVSSLHNEAINNILNSNSGKDFLNFKHQKPGRNHFYDLIIRSALKLPFLAYSPYPKNQKNLGNLSLQINNSVPSQLTEIFKKSLSVDWTDENILEHVESIWGTKS
ncbi:ABC-three component system middle component 1 [Pseudomonas syringae]|uniref:ABC-three component system middle component 1 n=1 Tax=Pseudomonas syringae TaxID=317 RepID=UPI00073FA20A|nr:ABC-three component system middle component 1 [Pseudomonas syringae]